jgi:hypothetical protein
MQKEQTVQTNLRQRVILGIAKTVLIFMLSHFAIAILLLFPVYTVWFIGWLDKIPDKGIYLGIPYAIIQSNPFVLLFGVALFTYAVFLRIMRLKYADVV